MTRAATPPVKEHIAAAAWYDRAGIASLGEWKWMRHTGGAKRKTLGAGNYPTAGRGSTFLLVIVSLAGVSSGPSPPSFIASI